MTPSSSGLAAQGRPRPGCLLRRAIEVLMVDRTHFPSDTVSTHCVTLGGVIQLRRWGLLDRVLATNVPFVPSFTLTIGPNEFNDPDSGRGSCGDGVPPPHRPGQGLG